MITAKIDSSQFPGLQEAISAILFLGTPHRGSAYARYATILSHIANVFVKGFQLSRLIGPVHTNLLSRLQTNEGDLLRLAEDFRNQITNVKIFSFTEQKAMQGFNERVP